MCLVYRTCSGELCTEFPAGSGCSIRFSVLLSRLSSACDCSNTLSELLLRDWGWSSSPVDRGPRSFRSDIRLQSMLFACSFRVAYSCRACSDLKHTFFMILKWLKSFFLPSYDYHKQWRTVVPEWNWCRIFTWFMCFELFWVWILDIDLRVCMYVWNILTILFSNRKENNQILFTDQMQLTEEFAWCWLNSGNWK